MKQQPAEEEKVKLSQYHNFSLSYTGGSHKKPGRRAVHMPGTRNGGSGKVERPSQCHKSNLGGLGVESLAQNSTTKLNEPRHEPSFSLASPFWWPHLGATRGWIGNRRRKSGELGKCTDRIRSEAVRRGKGRVWVSCSASAFGGTKADLAF